MARERKIVGLWPATGAADSDGGSAGGEADNEAAMHGDVIAFDSLPEGQAIELWDDAGLVQPPARRAVPWAAIVIAMSAAAWIGWVAYQATSGFAAVPPLSLLIPTIATACAPLALLLLGWIAIDRGSARSVQRHLRLLAAVRGEQQQLADRLALVDAHWAEAQETLATRGRDFAAQLTDASQRIAVDSTAVEARMREAMALAVQLNGQGDLARRSMDGLTIALPKAEEVARRAGEGLRSAGQTAYQLGGQLEERIAALHAEAAEAELRIDRAASLFLARAGEVGESAALADRAAAEAGDRFDATLAVQRDAALAMLADLAGQMEGGAAAIAERLRAIAERMEASIGAGVNQVDARLADTAARIDALDGTADDIVLRTAEAGSVLEGRTAALAAGLADFEVQTKARLGALAHDVDGLMRQLDGVATASVAGDAAARSLIETARDCVATLAGATHEVDVVLPAAIERLTIAANDGRSRLELLTPSVTASTEQASNLVEQLHTAERLAGDHGAALSALDRMGAATLGAQADAVARIQAAIDALAEAMRHVAETAAPAMATSAGVAETRAQDAAAAAQAAVVDAAKTSASEVERAIVAAIDAATGDGVARRVAGLVTGAEQAVAAANGASEKLMRQLITIADSSAAIEARVAENHAAVEAQDRDSLARQFALASESLQSMTVDMTRILSADVSDQAWEGYLKGDRGIFARRTVRLLTGGEARDVLARYNADDAFRGLTNRYIHDFEGLLRSVMDTRDGGALSVTLLSSDIGKVYVALAQAIERLRN